MGKGVWGGGRKGERGGREKRISWETTEVVLGTA